MFKTKVILIFNIFLSFLSLTTVSGQNAELEKVFSAAINAVGGAKEINQIRSLEVIAECVGPKGKYTTEIVSFRDRKTRFRQKFSYKNELSDIFIKDNLAWDANGYSLVPPFQRLAVELHEYQKMSFDFQKMFHDFVLEGPENFAGRPSLKVRAQHELNGPIYLFFNAKTKLFAGFVLPIPNSGETIKNVIDEWKLVGKLKLPSKATATDSSGDWVLNFEKISLNKSDAKMFEVPPRVIDLIELTRLHEQQRAAHLSYNAEMFIEMFADNLTQIQRGNASNRTKAENLAHFKNYFSTFKFIEWEDLQPPVIKISRDGTLATIIVQKRVRGTYRNEKGEEVPDRTDFAWLEVWEKQNNQWKIVTVASTEKVVENSK
jgi:hypothetical protein